MRIGARKLRRRVRDFRSPRFNCRFSCSSVEEGPRNGRAADASLQVRGDQSRRQVRRGREGEIDPRIPRRDPPRHQRSYLRRSHHFHHIHLSHIQEEM